MSYAQRYRRRLVLVAGRPMVPRPGKALGSIQSQPPGPRVYRKMFELGSLGAAADGDNTLSQPTITDPTAQWQGDVLTQLQAGVATLQKAELQKWLQIAATLSIPLAAAVWRMIFKKGVGDAGI